MEKKIRDYLNLIQESLRDCPMDTTYDYSDTNWEEMVKLAAATGMLGIVFKRLKDISANYDTLKRAVSGVEMSVFSMV